MVEYHPSSESERVVIAGDSHGNARFLSFVIDLAVEVGATRVWQVGDFGVWPGSGYFLDTVSDLAAEAGVVVEFIDGNHDDHDQIDAWLTGPRDPDGAVPVRPGLRYWPRGSVFTVAGRRVGCLGGAVSIDRHVRVPGRSWWPQEAPTANDVDRLVANAGGEALDVLLTHDAPSGSPVRSQFRLAYSLELACAEVRNLLAGAVDATCPALVVHGHWHQRARGEITRSDGGVTWVEGLDFENDASWLILDLATLEVIDRTGPRN